MTHPHASFCLAGLGGFAGTMSFGGPFAAALLRFICGKYRICSDQSHMSHNHLWNGSTGGLQHAEHFGVVLQLVVHNLVVIVGPGATSVCNIFMWCACVFVCMGVCVLCVHIYVCIHIYIYICIYIYIYTYIYIYI